MEKKYIWALKSTGIGFLWSLLFWYLVFNLFAWYVLAVPMGLVAAIYPLFFSLPVLCLLFGYEILIANFINEKAFLKNHKYFWTLGLPMLLISISLILFCPTETGNFFIEDLWHMLFSA